MADLPNLAKVDYVDRVNRAIDHVTRNLSEPLKLEDVAKVACFSPYHFHRIFRALVGETLHDFVKRVRLDRALYLISHSDRPSLTQVALACGFSSSSDFSRSFRERFGISPREFDIESFRRGQRDRLIDAMPAGTGSARMPEAANPDAFKVRLRDLPERRVAYLRVFRPYEGDGVRQAITRLMAWAQERGLAGGQWLGYQWEDPTIVPLELCRYDVGVEIPPGARVDGDVSETRFPRCGLQRSKSRDRSSSSCGRSNGCTRAGCRAVATRLIINRVSRRGSGCPSRHGETHFEIRLQLAVVDAAAAI